MTVAAKIRRAFRHKNERAVVQHLELSPWGKQARPAQLLAGARKILRNHSVVRISLSQCCPCFDSTVYETFHYSTHFLL